MKPSAFEYYAPATLDECVSMLVEHEEDEPKLIAGGQSLVPLMNLRMARPEVLVDLNGIADLGYIREAGDVLALGAMTRYAEVESSPPVRALCPLLADATAHVGYPAIRNRGTVGGAVSHADPVAEWPCLVRTLDAELVVSGASGRRTVPAADFFAGLFTTALGPTDVLTEIRIPLRRGTGGWSFQEFVRKTGDYAVVAVALDLTTTDGVISEARIGFANLADRPVRSPAVEALLVGQPIAPGPPDELLEQAREALGAEQSSDADRIKLAGVLATRALTEAFARANGGEK